MQPRKESEAFNDESCLGIVDYRHCKYDFTLEMLRFNI